MIKKIIPVKVAASVATRAKKIRILLTDVDGVLTDGHVWLMNVVALIATRFKTDVCSAYLLEPDRANLILAATLGCARNVSAHCVWLCTKVSRDSWPSMFSRSPSNKSKAIRASNILVKRAKRRINRSWAFRSSMTV